MRADDGGLVNTIGRIAAGFGPASEVTGVEEGGGGGGGGARGDHEHRTEDGCEGSRGGVNHVVKHTPQIVGPGFNGRDIVCAIMYPVRRSIVAAGIVLRACRQ